MDVILILGLFFTVVMIAIALKGKPEDRIRSYVESRGGRVLRLDRRWGAGTRSSKAYTIRYKDDAGRVHDALCQTGHRLGVCFTQDQVIDDPVRDEIQSLREEVARLRKKCGKTEA